MVWLHNSLRKHEVFMILSKSMQKIKAVISSLKRTFLAASSSISRRSREKDKEKKMSPVASSFSLKAKNIATLLGRKIFSLLKVAGILLRNVVTALSKKVKRIGKQKGKEIEELLKKQSASSSSVKANTLGKEKGVKLGQLPKQLAIILGTKSYQLARQAGQKIRYTIKQDNLYYNNLVKGIQKIRTEKKDDDLPLPDPEIITKIVALNEKLAEELRQQVIGEGINCQAIEVNSLPIEHKPYYSYKFPMSPMIVTNRGCISVKGRKFI
jgi:hypothetical protein